MEYPFITLTWSVVSFRVPCMGGPVGLGCRIHKLHLRIGVRPPNECPVYDIRISDAEAPVMPEFWGMQRTPL